MYTNITSSTVNHDTHQCLRSLLCQFVFTRKELKDPHRGTYSEVKTDHPGAMLHQWEHHYCFKDSWGLNSCGSEITITLGFVCASARVDSSCYVDYLSPSINASLPQHEQPSRCDGYADYLQLCFNWVWASGVHDHFMSQIFIIGSLATIIL